MSIISKKKESSIKKRAVYHLAYYDENGKRRGKTFTGSTLTEAKLKAEEWEVNRIVNKKPSLTVSECVEGYIEVKYNIIAPSTRRCYEGYKKTRIDPTIGSKSIKKLTKAEVQKWVSDLSAEGLSPKTVKNIYMLFHSAVLMYDEDFRMNIQLPSPKKFENHCPSDKEIQELIKAIREEGDQELLIAVLLAAFGPMRRSEICALTSDDVNGNTISVTKALVRDNYNEWVLKEPKTYHSNRQIEFPPFVVKELEGIEGAIIKCTPDAIGKRFYKLLRSRDLTLFRFHDLRHYGASIMHFIGVPDKVIELRGGWSPTSLVLRKIYQNAIDKEVKTQTKKINSHFTKLKV